MCSTKSIRTVLHGERSASNQKVGPFSNDRLRLLAERREDTSSKVEVSHPVSQCSEPESTSIYLLESSSTAVNACAGLSHAKE